MSKKKLLSESQVRRFMGLAGLSPINESYGMDEDVYEQKEEPMMEAEEEMPEMDMEEEPEMEGGEADVEMDEEDLADVKSALDTLQSKLAPLLDQAEGGDEMPEEEPEMEDDMDMDAELEDVDMEATEEEEQEMQEQIVNEVARRVAKRIVEAKRAHKKMNEALGRKK
jgi:hypothetical protein